MSLQFPGGAKFAFTILDDTDDATVTNCEPVYEFLHSLKFITTKTVWAFDTAPENQGPFFAGETLANPGYLRWTHDLHQLGFEIAFHNATMGSSKRKITIDALDFLLKEFGEDVRIHCNHGLNAENLSWGAGRYKSGFIRFLLLFWSRLRDYPKFYGSEPDSEYYWSDIAEQRIDYIRAFAYKKLNCSKITPGRPFLDQTKQRKVTFFNSCDAPDVFAYNQVVTPESINSLRQQGGWAIVSTHLGKGFYRNGRLDDTFQNTMRYLAKQPGWFVSVSELLDYLVSQLGRDEINFLQSAFMEYSHLIDRAAGSLKRVTG